MSPVDGFDGWPRARERYHADKARIGAHGRTSVVREGRYEPEVAAIPPSARVPLGGGTDGMT